MKLGEYLLFCFMALWTGLLTIFSTPAAVCAGMMAFGFGVDLICQAIRESGKC